MRFREERLRCGGTHDRLRHEKARNIRKKPETLSFSADGGGKGKGRGWGLSDKFPYITIVSTTSPEGKKNIFCISHQHIFGILVLILASSVCVDIRVRAPSLILLAMWGPLNQTVEVSNSVLSRPKQMLHI